MTPTHIVIDRTHARRPWHFRGAFYNFADACLTAERLGDITDGSPVEYQILRWRDWSVATEGMSQSRRTSRPLIETEPGRVWPHPERLCALGDLPSDHAECPGGCDVCWELHDDIYGDDA